MTDDSRWQTMDSAPKDGTAILLWNGRTSIGSFRKDDNFPRKGKLWLMNDHDDRATGYASTPLVPTHWQPLPEPPK